MSFGPPGEKGTTIFTGRAGYVCPCASRAKQASARLTERMTERLTAARI
jgi:hypothetical protein